MFLQYIFNGLAIGMAYALVAVGYSLVFGILRLINFSHGSVYTFGAHMTMMFIGFHWGAWYGVLASVILSGVLGVLIDKIALAPLRRKKSIPIASLITTIGVSYIIQNMLMIIFGSERKSFPNFFDFGGIDLGNIPITSSQLILFTISLLLLLLLQILLLR